MDGVLASTLKHGDCQEIDCVGKVTAIDTYICHSKDLSILTKLIPILTMTPIVFSYDLTVLTKSGKIKLRLNPLLTHVQRGLIVEGTVMNIRKLKKVENSPFFYFMIDELCLGVNSNFIPNHLYSNIMIENYKPIMSPLGDRSGTYSLDRITLNDLILTGKNTSLLKINFDGMSMLNRITLKNLDKTWTKLNMTKDLVVRVLSVSKAKMIVSSRDSSVMVLCNILIADSSATSILTAFDDAAVIMRRDINENDVLFLKSYRTSMFNNKSKARKMSYQLQPKVRLGLSPTQLEIKVNTPDLKSIYVVDSTVKTIPEPVWALKTISETLKRKDVGYLTDVLGIVMAIGRPEREIMYLNNKPTGQYWLRYWVALQDYSTQEMAYVKLYLDRKNWLKIDTLIPGDQVLISHLLIKLEDAKMYFLSTNETSIFVQTEFASLKFAKCKLIKKLEHDLFTRNLKTWSDRFKSATTGGFMYPLKLNISKDIFNISLTQKFQLQHILKTLPFRASKRIIVKGRITKYSRVTVKHGIVMSEEALIYNKKETKLNYVGDKGPIDIPNSVFGLSRNEIIDYQTNFWKSQSLENLLANPTTKFLAEIELDDCIINCEMHFKSQSESEIVFNLVTKLELEVYRYNVPSMNLHGVQIICLGTHERENLSHQSPENFEHCETQDIIDVLNSI